MPDTPIRRRRWPFVAGGLVALVIVAVLVFQWDWLIPLVQRRASAAIGRPVTITHLHVSLGRKTRIEAEGITIGNPADWPGSDSTQNSAQTGAPGTFATAERLGLDLDALALIQHRQVVLPVIDIQAPHIDAQQLPDGRNNWTFATGGSDSSGGPDTKLGILRIAGGQVHVVLAKLAADFNVSVDTQDSKDGTGEIVAKAQGTYAKQPITADFVGGALLSLRDAATPYPVKLNLANGPTRISLDGTVQDPLAFKGTSLKLDLSGPDMERLMPLIGIALPATPPYRVAGKLDYADGVVKFSDMAGKVGASDLEGALDVDTRPERPVLNANLSSKLVDLKDLAGFIGAEPGDKPGGRSASAGGRVLPNDPISLPKLNTTDVHLKYRAGRIQGRAQPLDNLRTDMDIVNGQVHLHPLAVGIGNGELKLFMGPGGNVSALLVDLSGLQFGNALLSALGIPDRATLQCMAVDLVLEKGLATARTLLLDTDEARVGAKGWISLNREMIGLVMETDAKHFSVGSLPTPIDVGGTFAKPSVSPQAGPLAVRGGAAIALGIVGTPLAALLPTIQFGTGEDGACARLLPQVRSAPRMPAATRSR